MEEIKLGEATSKGACQLPSTAPVVEKTNPRIATKFEKFTAELHCKIFKLLIQGSSACLGLTCKALYKVHKDLHGIIPLNTLLKSSHGEIRRYREGPGMYEHFFFLGDILYEWGGTLGCGYKRNGKWGCYLKCKRVKIIEEIQESQETPET